MIEGARRALARHPTLAGAGGSALALLAYLTVRDPHRPSAPLACPVKLATGLDCPGCGGLRVVHDLLHGDLDAAVHDNPFLLVCGPLLAALVVRSRAGAAMPHNQVLAPRLAYGLAGSAAAWMVVRNLPRWPLKPAVG
ncbi:MAG: DUF2752 domain-containing protein [Candidatus Dormibacteria bacterium]